MSDPSFLIIDDLLDEDTWSHLWTYFQYEALARTTRTEGAWKWEDGEVLAGPDFHALAPDADAESVGLEEGLYPTDTPVDYLMEAILEITAETGFPHTPWSHLAGRAYVYPSGTGLTWHRDDHERYGGAFVYYAHPEWNVQWGGELLVADLEDPLSLPVMPFRFDNRDYSEALLDGGVGRFILPKPNRLVLLGAQPHAVAPVRTSAGRNVRASLAGFFVR